MGESCSVTNISDPSFSVLQWSSARLNKRHKLEQSLPFLCLFVDDHGSLVLLLPGLEHVIDTKEISD